MTNTQIINWLGYWNRASMGPNLHHVSSFEDMVNCRRYNPAMQRGLFYDVTDSQLWDAFRVWRA